ncbi:CAP domain-containing protein [Paracoccus caeni]|uniref:CAP domain-containing protein n=1 Tax=Paracoccus caeni TaxID=657651 RepID=A0A934VUY7_9RHOB|nr:CAP domain-containing protein [Paracoccus caeni]MBK4216331.1 CAP domain-containing protein [Paracoccus caeni]
MIRKTAVIALISVVAIAGCGRDRGAFPQGEALVAGGGAVCAADPLLPSAMVDAVNAARAGQGKSLLKPDERLSGIAQSHACDIASHNRASVEGSDGSGVVDRARAARYPTCGVAQLVSVGGSADAAVSRWLASGPHRDELLAQTPVDIGAGVVRGPDGRLWWSLVLGENCR